jgi:hypothetical protein
MRPTIHDKNLPPIPDRLGSWVKVDRVAIHDERVTFRVTYENPVGGTVAHRFRTLRRADEYARMTLMRHPHAALLQGRTVTH